MAGHSSSGGRGTSLSRDSDGRDCVSRSLQQRVLRGDTCDDPLEEAATSGTCWVRL